MPIFSLHEDIVGFPPPELASDYGLLAIGGSLSIEWLIEAYSSGVFPWFNEDEPIMWWSPDPRSVIVPGEVKIAKSMRKYFKKAIFELRIDHAFDEVVRACKTTFRKDQDGTWITDDIVEAYNDLHNYGLAHSFETWFDGKLVGGLYGVSLGKLFFGESMFAKMTDASKFALISLSNILKNNNFELIDCQIPNPHLINMGCKDMSREEYIEIIGKNDIANTVRGNWSSGIMNLDFSI